MKIVWIIDTVLTERQYDCGFPTLAEAAREAGHEVYEFSYRPFDDNFKIPTDTDFLPYTTSGCAVIHGSIQFCTKLTKNYKHLCPGSYRNEIVCSYEKFAVPLRDYILNDDYYILPYKEVLERGVTEPIFIKPLSGLKQFTGKVLTPYNFKHEINSMNQIERVDEDLLCVLSSCKMIQSEFRYIICDREVVTGSEYRWDNVLDVRIDTLPECDALAEKIAKMDWQADSVYVCDIAMTDKGPKVIELNSFSSSGLYACDTRKIVDAVSEAAWKEYNGDLE